MGWTDCFAIGHIGRFTYPKNPMFLLEAVALAKEELPRARLMLIGTGNGEEAVQRRAVELGVRSEVFMPGYQEQEEMTRLMQAIDLFGMPSHAEGLGVAAIEAQAMGLPCLLSLAVPQEAAIAKNVQFLPIDDPTV